MIRSDDYGKLILRLALGVLILLHGISKLTGGIGFISDMVTAHGLPAQFAYLVYIGEVLAPAMIIVGLLTRPAALVIVINMLVALWLVHQQQLGLLNKNGGWELELQGMYLFGAMALVFLGAGRISVGGVDGPLN